MVGLHDCRLICSFLLRSEGKVCCVAIMEFQMVVYRVTMKKSGVPRQSVGDKNNTELR